MITRLVLRAATFAHIAAPVVAFVLFCATGRRW